MMTDQQNDLIDITDLFKRLCLESNVRYNGERMIVKRDAWERWQYGLLKEYLAEADTDDSNEEHETD